MPGGFGGQQQQQQQLQQQAPGRAVSNRLPNGKIGEEARSAVALSTARAVDDG
jgi:CCR4-NOT transcription complex subunit 2